MKTFMCQHKEEKPQKVKFIDDNDA